MSRNVPMCLSTMPLCQCVSLAAILISMLLEGAVFFEAVRMEDAFFIYMEAGRVLHIACPFHYCINGVFRYTVAKGIVIIVFALAQHFGSVESGGLVNEVEDH